MHWKTVKTAITVLALILLITFVLQNVDVVQVEFLFWRLEASRAVIYLSLFVLGGVCGWLWRSLRRGRDPHTG